MGLVLGIVVIVVDLVILSLLLPSPLEVKTRFAL